MDNYAKAPYEVLGTFGDIESGNKSNRPQLQEAISLAKQTGATLLTAKLNMSMSAALIATLIVDKKLNFTVVTMPYADTFQTQVCTALAQQEREFINMRTKAALAEAKAKCVKLSGNRPKNQSKRKEA